MISLMRLRHPDTDMRISCSVKFPVYPRASNNGRPVLKAKFRRQIVRRNPIGSNGSSMLCETGISTVRRKLLWLICLSALIAATRGTVAATISIGGQNLDFEILGKNGPVVVFEAGLGNETSTWRLIAPAVSRIGRAFLYDRAGLGKSVPLQRRDVPITAEDAAKSL